MTLSVDLFWSFRSPYSYLALPKACSIADAYDVAINARPVYPLAVRDPTFFKRTNPNFARYVVLDSRRVAEHEGIPFRFPRPDPIVQNMTTLEVASEQPLIQRLTRLGAAAQLAGRGLPFIREVSRTLYDGSVDGWDRGEHLARAASAAGFNLAQLDAAVAADPSKYDAIIKQTRATTPTRVIGACRPSSSTVSRSLGRIGSICCSGGSSSTGSRNGRDDGSVTA